ncbi:hypothetical protein NKH18_27250 [Streptomyces sp. M10(2022)]
MANAALSAYRTTYGTKVPAGEAVFFPELPVRLDKVTVKTGDSRPARSAPSPGPSWWSRQSCPVRTANCSRRAWPSS